MNCIKSFSSLLIIVCTQSFLYAQARGESCEIGGVVGECVSLAECPELVSLLKNSSSTAEGLNATHERRCGFDTINIKVCCPSEEERSLGLIRNLDRDGPSLYVDALPDHETCGLAFEVRDNKMIKVLTDAEVASGSMYVISNGIPLLSRDMARYMAVLGYKDSFGVRWDCGGSIITEKHILTAAHCIKKSLYVVRVGEIDLLRRENDAGPVDHLVKKKIPHEHYSMFHNDIGIIVLEQSINFKEYNHIGPICLPTDSKKKKLTKYGPYTGSRAGLFVAGWGEAPEKNERPSFLSYAPVHFIDDKKCRRLYAKDNRTIDERVFCAGDEDYEHDACNGDSGGPLVAEYELPEFNRTFLYQLGIISYGYRCSAGYYAGVYTNVTYFLPWIQEKVLATAT